MMIIIFYDFLLKLLSCFIALFSRFKEAFFLQVTMTFSNLKSVHLLTKMKQFFSLPDPNKIQKLFDKYSYFHGNIVSYLHKFK